MPLVIETGREFFIVAATWQLYLKHILCAQVERVLTD